MKFLARLAPFFAVLIFHSAAAAVPLVYFHLPQSSVAPGSEFALNVFLKSEQSVNAFEIAVEFTPETLQFLGYRDKDSILDVWQTRPTLSAPNLVAFAGGTYGSFKGEKGELITLHFKTKGEGTAGFALRGSNLYAADGKATQIVTSPFFIKLAVDKNSPLLVLDEKIDKTPPSLTVNKISNPEEGGSLLIFEVKDAESGGGRVLSRTFEDWRWSAWNETVSPVKFPETAWALQILAQNGVGGENSAFFLNTKVKLFAVSLALIIVLGSIYFWYNKYKSTKWV